VLDCDEAMIDGDFERKTLIPERYENRKDYLEQLVKNTLPH
jgi:hypothetical protein